eukprot:c20187_g1_i1.p1 GENE.c20187_g1_i1~~c20187_g1_i1.p1  ORF type:complete len:515 (-),score=112.60 c20187_g1_i1:67-1611(-)
MRLFVFVLPAFAALLCTAAPAGDRLYSLPGYDGPLLSKFYAGYADSNDDGTMHTHYLFVESENNPQQDPVLLWFNGGPGAPSLYGAFVELGPFSLDSSSLKTAAYNRTGIPTLYPNPHSWTKVANLLFVNAPPPVGYSYCDEFGPAGNGTSCGDWNDERTADANHKFLVSWMKLFPEYAQHPVFISGESYAGVYVPTLARAILSDPNNKINLQGFAVGDGCVGTQVNCGAEGAYWDVEFFHGHGQYSEPTYQNIQLSCTEAELHAKAPLSPRCQTALQQMSSEIGGYFAYGLYDECFYDDLFAPHATSRFTNLKPSIKDGVWVRPSVSELQAALNDYPCGGGVAFSKWVTTPAVKAAFHVAPDAFFFAGDNGVGFVYNTTETDLRPFYIHVAQNTSVRALVYNGDTDPAINSLFAANWTAGLGLEQIEAWRPWTVDGKLAMAGYVTRYAGNFDFLTVRGSGHMVPLNKPTASLEFITRWLRGEAYQRYSKTVDDAPQGSPRGGSVAAALVPDLD